MANSIKTIKQALSLGAEILKKAGIENPVHESYALLSFQTGKDRLFLYAHDTETLEQTVEERFFSCIDKRADGMPFAYITNEKEFMGLSFYTDSRVLIPRPDTETLVDTAVNQLRTDKNNKEQNNTEQINKTQPSAPLVLDLCTGSGAVGISIAYYTGTYTYLTDISDEALAVCKINAERHLKSGTYKILKSDLYSAFDEPAFYESFSVVTANPPYIPDSEFNSLSCEVKAFEPELALRAGENGLFFYEKIVPGALMYLKSGGILAVECGYNQADSVIGIFSGCGYADINAHCDLSGIRRVVAGVKK